MSLRCQPLLFIVYDKNRNENKFYFVCVIFMFRSQSIHFHNISILSSRFHSFSLPPRNNLQIHVFVI